MPTFSDFLLKNTVKMGGVLPLVHTTRAYHLRKLAAVDKIEARPCDVFAGENLSYFFVGRPAYKYRSDDSEAEYWELPCCFIFEFGSVRNVKRIFPFDSGAFASRLYPPYLNSMELDAFEASSAPDAASRIIGAFFGDASSYFQFKRNGALEFESEFGLGVFDAEIKALHRLSREKSPATFDDRRFSIEVQTPEAIDLELVNPLAVIAPAIYFGDEKFREHVENVWKSAPIGYPVYTLSSNQYFYAIYERVHEYFKLMGYL